MSQGAECTCPYCHSTMMIPRHMAGTIFSCPNCSKKLTAPAPDAMPVINSRRQPQRHGLHGSTIFFAGLALVRIATVLYVLLTPSALFMVHVWWHKISRAFS